MGARAAAGAGRGGGRPAQVHGDPRQGRLHLSLPQRRDPVAISGDVRAQQLLHSLIPFN